MAIHVGSGLFGKVDRVPGLFFVATRFYHVNFFPIHPQGSYLVFEGKVDSLVLDWDEQKIEDAVFPIRWSLKSVLFAYLRAVMIVCAIFMVIGAVVTYERNQRGQGKPELILLTIAGILLLLILLWLSYRWTRASPYRALELAQTVGIEPEVVAGFFVATLKPEEEEELLKLRRQAQDSGAEPLPQTDEQR